MITILLYAGTLAGHGYAARVLATRLTGTGITEFVVLCFLLGILHIVQVGRQEGTL